MARLLLTIGNTHCTVADAETMQCQTYATAAFSSQWKMAVADSAVAACVVPQLQLALEKRYPSRIHFISWRDFPEVDFSGYDFPRLGADRIANAVAARVRFPGKAVLVLDCGTAVNSVAVSAQGRFAGGVILPGRVAALHSLHEGTAQLPALLLTEDASPLSPLGKSTQEGMLAGISLALLGAVEKIVSETRRIPGFETCRLLLTGGDAPFYLRNLPAFREEAILISHPLALDALKMLASKESL